MLISTKWLQDFVSLPAAFDARALAHELTMKVSEVEAIKRPGAGLEGVVVGELLSFAKHPDADKLHVAQVDVGEAKPRQIIFGQMVEMQPGYKVPVALAPTTLPGAVTIKRAKLRGVLSEGMLCLDQELGLVKDGVSITFFDQTVKNGTPIVAAMGLDDVIFDIDNKSLTHRPDLWGHYGMAREVAALQKQKLKPLDPPALRPGNELKLRVAVEEPALCPRYQAVAVSGITIAPSPAWLQTRLKAVGVRPINNIVDITNYVLHEIGQPTHAFDARSIAEHELIIRRAKAGETFTTLDDEERTLSEDMLLITDKEKALAIAGVMGGANSEIRDDTQTVVFESANFDAASIRKTSQTLCLRTESSARWEKSLDPHQADTGLRRLVELTLQLCPGARVASNIVDQKDFNLNQGPIALTFDFINQKIGTEIDRSFVVDSLERLGFVCKKKKDHLLVTVPTWRATKDIQIAEDVVEEVLRLYGYDQVPSRLPRFTITPPAENVLHTTIRQVREVLAYGCGFSETYGYSFVAPELLQTLDMEPAMHLELDNPVAKDRPYLRRHILPNLLTALEKNLHRFDEVGLFELGRVYIAEEAGEPEAKGSEHLLPRQDTLLGMVYAAKGNERPFYVVADAVKRVLGRLALAYTPTVPTVSDARFVHPGRYSEIELAGKVIAKVAELHPRLQARMGIDARVGMVEVNISTLSTLLSEQTTYRELGEYPPVKRDIALVVERGVRHEDVAKHVNEFDSLIVGTELFDVYEDAVLGKYKKSMAYHVTYQSPEKTLETSEVDALHDKLTSSLQKKFKADIRK